MTKIKSLSPIFISLFFLLSINNPIYSTNLFIAIDISKQQDQSSNYFNDLSQIIEKSIIPNIQKEDHLVLMTYAEKIQILIKKEIIDPQGEAKEIISEVKHLSENNKKSFLDSLLYETYDLMRDYSSIPGPKILFVFSRNFSGTSQENISLDSKKLSWSPQWGQLKIALVKWVKELNKNEDKKNSFLDQVGKTIPIYNYLAIEEKVKPDLSQIFNPDLNSSISQPAVEELENKSQVWIFLSSLWNRINTYLVYLALGLVFLVFITYIFIQLKKGAVQQFYGYLEFYDKETSKPQKKILDLARLRKKKIIIGGSKKNDIFLRGSYLLEPIILEAPLRPQKEISLTEDMEKKMEFTHQKQKGLLSSGDSFKIASYVFVYYIR